MKIITLCILMCSIQSCIETELIEDDSYTIRTKSLTKYQHKSDVLYLKILSAYKINRNGKEEKSMPSADTYLCYVHNTSDTIWVFELKSDRKSEDNIDYISQQNSSVIAFSEDIISIIGSDSIKVGIKPQMLNSHPAVVLRRIHVED